MQAWGSSKVRANVCVCMPFQRVCLCVILACLPVGRSSCVHVNPHSRRCVCVFMLYFVTLPTSTRPLTRTRFLRRWNPLEVPKPGALSLRFLADFWILAARRMSRSPSQGWIALCKDFLFSQVDIHANFPPLIQPISMISATYYSNIVFYASSTVHIP